MDISKVLNVNHIKLNMVAKTKKEALEELTDILVQDGIVINKDKFLRDIWLREELGPTGFENHIAIPHGQSSAVRHSTLAIGRTPHKIPWETIDGIDIRCIILYAIRSEEKNTTHIRLLTQVSYALANEDIIAKLLEENDPKNIIEMFDAQDDVDF
ncbi:fructose PTS transporter subunit IIA [Vibrio sp. dsl-7]|uniref:Fructose PTS transporter subunit IIA n=1 Tax=Vibrio chanodichtyis TaxID=3027932 RepID=A0ABT5UZ23_9VIBR|nr:fructose PTS transporter subunit IIA [Vibrio chanodichtyis]MDE1514672.1 fructose PTS transporter subunit IIA [Vibrio chanodichtyis]